MSRKPYESNTYAIPGSVDGAKTREELTYHSIAFPTDPTKSITSIFSTSLNIMKQHVESVVDTQSEPKYMGEDGIYHLAGGSLTVNTKDGTFQMAGRDNDIRSPMFELNKKNSKTSIQTTNTELGSTLISTLDGFLLHPLGTELPSTPFTPIKGWIKQLFPGIDTESVIFLSIMELVQGLLLSQAADFLSNNSGTNIENKTEEKDLGTIIIENRDRFFTNGSI